MGHVQQGCFADAVGPPIPLGCTPGRLGCDDDRGIVGRLQQRQTLLGHHQWSLQIDLHDVVPKQVIVAFERGQQSQVGRVVQNAVQPFELSGDGRPDVLEPVTSRLAQVGDQYRRKITFFSFPGIATIRQLPLLLPQKLRLRESPHEELIRCGNQLLSKYFP